MTTNLLLALLPLCVVLGGESPPPPPLPSVAEVLRRFEIANGPGEARSTLTSWRATGTTDLSGAVGTLTILRQRPDKIRIEVVVDGRRSIQGYDGELAWQEGVGQGPPQAVPMEPEAAARFVEEWADFDGALFDPQSKGLEVAVVGWEKVDGRRALRVETKFPSGRVHQWFLDAESFQPVQRITPNRHPRRGEVPRVWFYIEHERVSAVVVPKEFEREDSQMVRGYRLQNFEANPTLDPALFRMPSGKPVEAIP
jgi:hypothetical protein